MKYYFFKTSMEMRKDGKVRNTLHALPGQTLEDGTPIDSDKVNVSAPKEKGLHTFGSREDYPIGTNFCSTHLEIVKKPNQDPYYSVFDSDGKTDFHPVGLAPDQYLSASHRDQKMELAFVKFKLTGEQETTNTNTKPMKSNKKNGTFSGPADNSGKARSAQASFEPVYDNQLDDESELISQWVLRMMIDEGVRSMAKRPRVDAVVTEGIEELLRSGETIGTIISRKRFQAKCQQQKMDTLGLSSIAKGPLQWYIDELLAEHRRNDECSSVERKADDKYDVADMAFVLSKAMGNKYATNENPTSDPSVIPGIENAIKAGWDIGDIIKPEVIATHDNMGDVVKDIVTGVIPAPKHSQNTKSLFDIIATDKKLACPKAKNGFYIDKATWSILLRNMKVRVNTLITGPSGCGKTEVVKKLCEATNTPLTIISMGGVTDVTDHLVGAKDLDPATKGTKFDWAEFALAIQRPGVILLDEINRIPRGGANILYTVLDDNRFLQANGAKSTDTRTIKVHPDCVFFATANISKNGEFVDTNPIDEALRTRLTGLIPLGYMPCSTEAEVLCARTGIDQEDADVIAMVAKDIRQQYGDGTLSVTVSVRETLYTAGLVRDGLDVKDALEWGFLVHFEDGATPDDPSSERGTVKALIASHFKN